MYHNDKTTTTGSPLVTEQEHFLPPTKAQDPTFASHEAADAHNASILAVRGISTTVTGNELFNLARLALQNVEIPATPQRVSDNDAGLISNPDTGAVDAAAATSTVSGPSLPGVTTFEPFYFFFYGSLQIPDVLQCVCDIEDEGSITLRKNASVHGWQYKMWGPYPALVPAAKECVVEGTAWLCEKPEHVARLCTYETCAYRMAYCDVCILSDDGLDVEVIQNARTFVNNQSPDQLADGHFDVEEYHRDRSQFW